jgi:hypothetical protein
VALPCLLLLGVGLIFLLCWPDPVNNIRQGMTLAEVMAVLGEPEGPITPVSLPSAVVEYRWWLGGRGVGIEFALLSPNEPTGPIGPTTGRVWAWTPKSLSLPERIRNWLGW